MSVQIQQNIPLGKLSTLGVGGCAEYFATITSEDELVEAVLFAKQKNLPVHVIGGGSNVLVSDEGVQGLVIQMDIHGYQTTETGSEVSLTAKAGEILDDIVSYAVSKNLWGIENLSHIPGTIGAAPIQNIGAYGVEIKDVLACVRAYNTETENFEMFSNAQCAFAYRNSLFKSAEGKKYIVVEITVQLSKNANPKIEYKDLALHFTNVVSPTIDEVRQAVIEIRSRKFPNWNEVGTAGSFFKNPSVTKEKYAQLCQQYEGIPGYETNAGEVKLSLGWILDKILNIRGFTEGNVSTYIHQALVLVVQKGATASEVKIFADKIVEQIKNKIGVVVEWEVTQLE